MDPRLLMRHLQRALEISLGDVEVEDHSTPGLRHLFFALLCRVFTIWPPSRARLPEVWLPMPQAVFEVEKANLLAALDSFVEAHAREPQRQAVHTLFGPLSLRSWSRLHGVHFNHHLRQFGLVRPWEALEYWWWLAIPLAAVAVWLT